MAPGHGPGDTPDRGGRSRTRQRAPVPTAVQLNRHHHRHNSTTGTALPETPHDHRNTAVQTQHPQDAATPTRRSDEATTLARPRKPWPKGAERPGAHDPAAGPQGP